MGENRCVVCGAIIPEGRMVCPSCENDQQNNDVNEEDKNDRNSNEIKYNI